MEQMPQPESTTTATMKTTHVRYEPNNASGTTLGPRDLTESDRDLFKAFQSAIADQVREHFPDLPAFDDSKLEPISVCTEVKIDSRFYFQVQFPNGHHVRASIIQPLGIPIEGSKIEREKMVHVELIQ
ncbi:unnamed protein product [Rotaria sordida]|uniref:Uncharacterized protein n=1 Tax=Rotaria sordida TaxID=392033 RepID=A0A815B6C0_9BILA|nr:unnamed protein product [Rotaria sordida]